MDVLDALDQLEALPSEDPNYRDSEADTRGRLIDPLLEALGWGPGTIRREPYAGWACEKGYIDYLLTSEGRSRYVIEAKRRGRLFNIPDSLRKQRHTSYKKLYSTGSPDLREALDQCLRYSQHTGAPYAAATNGVDWAVFKPSHPYRALPEAKVILFCGHSAIRDRLDEFENILSRKGIEAGKCETILLGKELRVPAFARKLRDLYPYHHPITVEEDDYNRILLEIIDPLLRRKMIDIADEEDLRECYVPVHGNFSTAATIGAAIISRPSKAQGNSKGNELVNRAIHPQSPSTSSTGRTLILHGSVGVGKTTFLRNCELELRRSGKLENIVWTRIDLLPFRDRPFQISHIEAILSVISREIQAALATATEAMPGSYDPQEWRHLRDIYNAEARQFQKARFPTATDSDTNYTEALREHIWTISQKDPQDHLLRTIRWLTTNKLPVVIVLDNSDQLGLEFQEYLHKLAQSIQSRTSAVTILVLRTEALASHRIREHAIASVDEYFQIVPAPLPTVLKRRFERIQAELNQIDEVKSSTNDRDMRTVAIERLSTLMDTIEYEAAHGTEAYRIIDAAGNGSIRDALRAIAALFRSSPKGMDAMVVTEHKKGRAKLDAERVLRALMKEDLRGLDSHRLVPNVFITEDQVYVPYSLGLRIIQQVRSRAALGDYSVSSLLNDFAMAGVDRSLCERVVTRLRRERLIVVPHILPDIREYDTISVTLLGEAVSDLFVTYGDYYSQSVFETFIYDSEVFYRVREMWNSHDEFSIKFPRMGRAFAYAIVASDNDFRTANDLSQLEPIVSSTLTVPAKWRQTPKE